MELRERLMMDLHRIKEENYQLREGEQLQEFVALMLQHIGDPDPELRDDLIYSTFYNWIHVQKQFSDFEMLNLIKTLINEHYLFNHIGNEGDLTVLIRAFSVLQIALILRRHRERPFLNQNDFENVKHALIRYYREEKDLRGYLPEEGWAHSAAHGADALVELVQCPESEAELQREILEAVQGMLQNGRHIFSEEEDERIATIVDTMINENLLPQQEIVSWISGLAQCGSWPRNRGQSISRVNCKNILRCLYFRREKDKQVDNLSTFIQEAEKQLNRFSQSQLI